MRARCACLVRWVAGARIRRGLDTCPRSAGSTPACASSPSRGCPPGRRGKTVLFSTHIMEHAEQLCDRLCIIARGKKLIDGTLAEVKRTHGGQHLIVAFDGSQGAAQRIFSDRRLVAKIQDFGQQAELELANGADPQEILRGLVESGASLARLALASPSLHKIFVDLVGPEAATAAAIPATTAAGVGAGA